VSPLFLEKRIDVYLEIFEAGTELSSDKPTIALKTGQILSRRQLIKLVKAAGTNGVHLKNLYLATRFSFRDRETVLEDVPEIEATQKGRLILYKWIEAALEEPENSRIQDFMSSNPYSSRSRQPVLGAISPGSKVKSVHEAKADFKIEFEDGSSTTLCLADPGSSVAVRDKGNAVEYLG
jgi:hypothetical protein